MKITYYITIALVALSLGSCRDLLDDLEFSASLDPNNTYYVGEPVQFNFDGNPNYIVFWSGDDGAKYVNRNRTEMEPEDVVSAKLSFTLSGNYGLFDKNSLTVYASNTFPGLSKDPVSDKNLITGFTDWTNLTTQYSIPDLEKGTTKEIGPIDLNDYKEGFVLAFHYKGATDGKSAPRTWTITNIVVESVAKNGALETKTTKKAIDLGFIAFEPDSVGFSKNPYIDVARSVKGNFLLNNIKSNSIKVEGGTQGPNNDWCISSPYKLYGSCDPDKGVAIKDMSTKLNTHSYVYTKPGKYTATIIAGNANIDGQNQTIREISFEIKERP